MPTDEKSTDKKLIELSKQFTLLIQEFKLSEAEISEQSKHNAYQLKKALVNVTQNIQTLLENSDKVIREKTHKAISDATNESLSKLEKRINNLCDRVDFSTARIEHASNAVTRQTKVTGWTVLVGIAIASITMLSVSAWYAWH